MSEQLEQVIQDIKARLDGIGKSVEPAVIAQMVKENMVEILKNDPEFVRKMKFGEKGDQRLMGSKFARHEFNTGDIELLYDVMTSNKRYAGSEPDRVIRDDCAGGVSAG